MARTSLVMAALATVALFPAATSAVELPQNDYPTSARADYVFAMTRRQAENVRAMAGNVEHRVHPVDEGDIEDPIGGTKHDYEECANRIEQALRRRLEEVLR